MIITSCTFKIGLTTQHKSKLQNIFLEDDIQERNQSVLQPRNMDNDFAISVPKHVFDGVREQAIESNPFSEKHLYFHAVVI